MYAVIANETYTTISVLSVNSEVDVTGNTLPADEVYVSIQTDDAISVGQYLRIYDDLDNLWAKFWIVGADREDAQHVQVHSLSDIAVLDYTEMPAAYYNAEPVGNILNAIFAKTHAGQNGYALASSLSGKTITGFCPKQTARIRLQWVCFAVCAFVRQSFSSKMEIRPIGQAVKKNILSGKIKYKPVVEYSDYVSKITLVAYTFTLTAKSAIAATDEWVQKDDNTYYVMTKQEFSATNPDFPSGLPDNEVVIDRVYLANPDNAGGILAYFKEMYFNRLSVSLDAINNAEFLPGEKVTAYTDKESLVAGYIQSCDFAFGLQSLSTIKLIAAEEIAGAGLFLEYHYDDETVYRERYYLPVGYPYSIPTQFVTQEDAYHRYLYRPLSDSATGTVIDGLNLKIVDCGLALHLNKSTKVLGIKSVDSVDWVSGSSEVVEIG